MKREELNLIAGILSIPFRLAILVALVAAGLLLLCNLGGLFFGFENPSPVCNALEAHKQTNFEYYAFPIAKYACKKNAGLLQPAVSNAIVWFGKIHE